MCVDAHIPSGASETLVFPVRYVFVGFRVDVLFGQPKVDDVDDVWLFGGLSSNQEVLWLHVPIDEVFGVNILHPRQLKRKEGEKISAD